MPSGQNKFVLLTQEWRIDIPLVLVAGTPTGWVRRDPRLLEGFWGTGVRVPVGGPARGACKGLAETGRCASHFDISIKKT